MGAGVVTYGLTGDALLDGLAVGVKWDTPNVTFSFPTAASNYGAGYSEAATFQAFNAQMADAVRALMAEINTFTNLNLTEITETDSVHADMRFGRTADVSTAWGYYPSASNFGGDVWVALSATYDAPVRGNYAWLTLAHEIGHGLGLKHPHEVSGGRPVLSSTWDALEFTVMSYRSYVGAGLSGYSTAFGSYPQSYMTLDLMALQFLYGANYSTRSTNTTYSWRASDGAFLINGVVAWVPAANKINITIWDGGGSDTIDLRTLWPQPSPISISPGTGTKTDSKWLPATGGTPPSANIYTARRYGGSSASDIESYLLDTNFLAATLNGAGTVGSVVNARESAAAGLSGSGSVKALAIARLIAACGLAGVSDLRAKGLVPREILVMTSLIADYVLDNGLSKIDAEADEIHLLSSDPVDYSDVTTNTLGKKVFGTGGAFAAPGDASPNGRKVASTPITDGVITGNGTVSRWAIVDSAGGRLLANGALVASQAVIAGDTFSLPSFNVIMPSS